MLSKGKYSEFHVAPPPFLVKLYFLKQLLCVCLISIIRWLPEDIFSVSLIPNDTCVDVMKVDVPQKITFCA